MSPIPVPLRLARSIDRINGWMGQGLAWLTLFLVIGTAVVVVLRYGFNIGATALQEAILYAHALVFMGCAAWVLQRNGHVRVDIFYQKFSVRRRALVDVLGHLFLLLPLALFIGWSSWEYVASSWRTREASGESGGLGFVYLHKSIILVLATSLALQVVADLMKTGYLLIGAGPPRESSEAGPEYPSV